MRVTKKVIAAVLILCMMLQISGAAVIADDAANSRGIEISGPTVEKGVEPVHAADIVSVSVEGGKSVSCSSHRNLYHPLFFDMAVYLCRRYQRDQEGLP